jgi:hypothetical protein
MRFTLRNPCGIRGRFPTIKKSAANSAVGLGPANFAGERGGHPSKRQGAEGSAWRRHREVEMVVVTRDIHRRDLDSRRNLGEEPTARPRDFFAPD